MHLTICGLEVKNVTPETIKRLEPKISFWKGRRFRIESDGRVAHVSLNCLIQAVHKSLKQHPTQGSSKEFANALKTLKNKGYKSSHWQFKEASVLTRILTRIKHRCSRWRRNSLLKQLIKLKAVPTPVGENKPKSLETLESFNLLPSGVRQEVAGYLDSPDASSLAMASTINAKDAETMPIFKKLRIDLEKRAFTNWKVVVLEKYDYQENFQDLSKYTSQIMERFPKQTLNVLKQFFKINTSSDDYFETLISLLYVLKESKSITFEDKLPFFEEAIEKVKNNPMHDALWITISQFLGEKYPERVFHFMQLDNHYKKRLPFYAAPGLISSDLKKCLSIIRETIETSNWWDHKSGIQEIYKLMAKICYINKLEIPTPIPFPENLKGPIFQTLKIVMANVDVRYFYYYFAKAYLKTDQFNKLFHETTVDQKIDLLLKRVSTFPNEALSLFPLLYDLMINNLHHLMLNDKVEIKWLAKFHKFYKESKPQETEAIFEKISKDAFLWDPRKPQLSQFFQLYMDINNEKATELIIEKIHEDIKYLQEYKQHYVDGGNPQVFDYIDENLLILMKIVKKHGKNNKKLASKILEDINNVITIDFFSRKDFYLYFPHGYLYFYKWQFLLAKNYFKLDEEKAIGIYESTHYALLKVIYDNSIQNILINISNDISKISKLNQVEAINIIIDRWDRKEFCEKFDQIPSLISEKMASLDKENTKEICKSVQKVFNQFTASANELTLEARLEAALVLDPENIISTVEEQYVKGEMQGQVGFLLTKGRIYLKLADSLS